MLRLFGYLFSNWKAIIIVLLLLLVQAFSDLSLPAHTSNIVNVGIQQSGIDDIIPRSISVNDMERLFLFVSTNDRERVLEAYMRDDSTYILEAYVLKKEVYEDQAEKETVKEILAIPMMLVIGFESDSELTNQLEQQIKEQMVETQAPEESQEEPIPEEPPRESHEDPIPEEPLTEDVSVFDLLAIMPDDAREQIIVAIEEETRELPDAIVSQGAVVFIKSAYTNLGIDISETQLSYLFRTGLIMLGYASLSMLAFVSVSFIGAKMAAKVGRDLRSKVFRKVVRFSNKEFDQFSTASLITRSTNDIQQIQLILVMMIRMILYAPILAIGGIFMVLRVNVSMVWIIALAIVLLAVLVIALFCIAMPKFKSLQKLVDGVNLVTREILMGLPVIRAFNTEKHEEERFDDANKILTSTNLFVNRAMVFMMPIMMMIMNGISVLIVWVAAHHISDGQMQVGDLMAFIQYTMQIIFAFLMLSMISIMLPRAGVASDRVAEVIASKAAINDPKEPAHLPPDAKGMLEFNNVSFKYPGADKAVLQDISFVAKPGETTAFIGSTGSGKSTLINLIPRFYDVTEGSITLDGIDIRQLSQHELRDKLGYVPQKGILFSGDIESNIMFGNDSGSKEEMIEAATIAQATEFIDEKEKGYQSEISQGGTNVSGGQKQRLSIARAIAGNPNLYIFDDSFSALDNKTDATLRAALKSKTLSSTVLIVAQRISTILHAQQIIVLDNGTIAGRGNHYELLESCEVYRQIASSQLSEAELQKGMTGGEGLEDD